jgi:hypothetical protein
VQQFQSTYDGNVDECFHRLSLDMKLGKQSTNKSNIQGKKSQYLNKKEEDDERLRLRWRERGRRR